MCASSRFRLRKAGPICTGSRDVDALEIFAWIVGGGLAIGGAAVFVKRGGAAFGGSGAESLDNAVFSPAPAVTPSAPSVASPPRSMSELLRRSEREVVARTIWGEARSEGRTGMAAVAAVIRNRALDGRSYFGGSTPRGVALAQFQFSVWNFDDANRRATLAVSQSDPHMVAALDLYDRVIAQGRNDEVPERVRTATHYLVSGTSAFWTNAPGVTRLGDVGKHRFYREA